MLLDSSYFRKWSAAGLGLVNYSTMEPKNTDPMLAILKLIREAASISPFKGTGKTILTLERGTWWTTPVATVQDKEIANYKFLASKGQPVVMRDWP